MLTKEQLDAHAEWVKDHSQGSRLVLSHANLIGANHSRANLSWANLIGANLSEANLSWANLREANPLF